jgi:secretory carrier-associated membrane protein
VIEEKNWPPFFPLIHHDISNEIPIHLQRMQYLAFSSFLGELLSVQNVLVSIIVLVSGLSLSLGLKHIVLIFFYTVHK